MFATTSTQELKYGTYVDFNILPLVQEKNWSSVINEDVASKMTNQSREITTSLAVQISLNTHPYMLVFSHQAVHILSWGLFKQ